MIHKKSGLAQKCYLSEIKDSAIIQATQYNLVMSFVILNMFQNDRATIVEFFNE